MIKLVSLILLSSQLVQASINKSWSLNTGKKHPLFLSGESEGSLEKKVFSKEIAFEERWRLVDQVADLKERVGAVVFLKKCLASKEWFLQSAALKVLEKRYPGVAVKLAEKALFNSKALVVRSEAVGVIATLGGPNNTGKLWKALNQKNNFRRRVSLWIRPQIVKSILKMERSIHSERWYDLLSDSNAEIRDIAKKVIAKQ